jgi:subtilisin family serine protease/fibronectin type 3 domain-containing protein
LGLDALQVDPNSYDEASILVRFRSEFGDAVAADGIGAGARILQGTQVGRQLGKVPCLHKVTLAEGVNLQSALNAYQQNPMVAYAEPNFRVSIADTIPNDPRFGEIWAFENTGQTGGAVDADIDAPRAWDVTHGSGSTIVAVIDTGVDYNHPDLRDNMWINGDEIAGDGIDNDGNGYVDDVYGYDFINRDGDPMDDQGHGTHIAGTIGAKGDNGIGVAGINWDVQIMALKFIGIDGWGDGADAIEAIYYALANGATITNASWGGDSYSQALYDAIAAARDANHVFVAAAGNGNMLGVGQNNDAALYYPASYDLDNIVAVAAVDHTDALASFSNYGATQVDLAAPGVNILSTTRGGGYGLNTGTSMAAPHATGVLALVQDLHPDWTYGEVINQVLDSVDPLPELYGITVTGGRLNAAAAVGNPEPDPPPPPAGTLPIEEYFGDGVADFFRPQVGNWDVGGGRYTATPLAENHELFAVTTLDVDDPLPANLEIQVTITADEGRLELFGIVFSDHLTNGYIVFDYHSPDDFKFAGADMRGDMWVIGHHDVAGWHLDAAVSEVLNAATNYAVRVVIEDGTKISLFAGEAEKLSHQYQTSLNDGDVGLGMRDSTTHYDNFKAREVIPDTFGPKLVSIGPFDKYSGSVSSIRLTFNEQIDEASFTVDDIELLGPAGPIPASSVTAVPATNGLQFDVAFTAQSALGEYLLVIGPEISDLAGNLMDGDGDGVNGEPAEDRSTAVFSILSVAEHIDFGTANSPVAFGYTQVIAVDVYSTESGYGWQTAVSGWNRDAGTDLLRDFEYGKQGTFLYDLPNGQYEVVVTMGDEGALRDQMSVSLEGVQMDVVTTAAGEHATLTCSVDVNDGQLTLKLADQGGSNPEFAINALEIIEIGPDRVPPAVVGVSPTETVIGSFDRVELTFDEPIDLASFTEEDVNLLGPDGPVAPLTVTALSTTSFEIVFPSQITPGVYELTVGPGISDLAGNNLAGVHQVDFEVEAETEYVARLDFGTANSPVATGYTQVIAVDVYSATSGYGWQKAVSGWNREIGTDLLRDFNYGAEGTFLYDLPNGHYCVTVILGDENNLHDLMDVFLEGMYISSVTTAAGEHATLTCSVDVNDGQLTLGLVDQGGSNANFAINALEIVVSGPDRLPPLIVEFSPTETVFGTFDRIELVFDEAIDPTSFSASDVNLVGPSGTIAPLTIMQLDTATFEVSFAPQSELGVYQLSVGPEIADLAGNIMAEVFLADFTIDAMPELIDRLDFGTSASPVAAGYTRVIAVDVYSAATGYGWLESVGGWNRNSGTDLLRDFNYGVRGTFLYDLDNGTYDITVVLGDEGSLHDQMAVFLEGIQVDTISTAAGQHATNTYTVDVSDGQLTMLLVDLGGSNPNFAINAMEITRLPVGTNTLNSIAIASIEAENPTAAATLEFPECALEDRDLAVLAAVWHNEAAGNRIGFRSRTFQESRPMRRVDEAWRCRSSDLFEDRSENTLEPDWLDLLAMGRRQ